MTNVVLILVGLVEFILRILLVIILVATMLGIVVVLAWCDDHVDFTTPYCWQLVRLKIKASQ